MGAMEEVLMGGGSPVLFPVRARSAPQPGRGTPAVPEIVPSPRDRRGPEREKERPGTGENAGGPGVAVGWSSQPRLARSALSRCSGHPKA